MVWYPCNKPAVDKSADDAMVWMLASIAVLCLRQPRPAAAFSPPRLARPLHSSSPLPNLTVSGDAAFVERLTRQLQQLQQHQARLPRLSAPAELSLVEGRLSVRFPCTGLKPFCIDLAARRLAARAADPAASTLLRALRGPAPAGQHVVFDLTAGLGRDAATAARAGMQVVMVERHPVVWAMLSDAMERLGAEEPRVAERMRLLHADARELTRDSLSRLQLPTPDVVFLDPMYAARTKHAKVKKEMQVLHLLLGDRTEEQQAEEDEALFAAAKALGPRRIVVKRQINAPPLVDSAKASGSVKGSTQRFDIYTTTTPGPDAPAT